MAQGYPEPEPKRGNQVSQGQETLASMASRVDRERWLSGSMGGVFLRIVLIGDIVALACLVVGVTFYGFQSL